MPSSVNVPGGSGKFLDPIWPVRVALEQWSLEKANGG
jgi:hypothetical protein